MNLLRRSVDGTLMALVEEAGRNVQRSSLLLHDLSTFPSTRPWLGS